ncbi:hypothetical protein Tdes44962_MAKER09624 [Teratosphaeria destructans]|uniref:Uncharacterized protein n=1 Tax=Teratosphaeria destructans TaxID=418781 RepID=A0A9W7SS40_9PEZI|nr:hypothetical protein Tdes44962_MAKER09624 [Teratosphaeria destructans]
MLLDHRQAPEPLRHDVQRVHGAAAAGDVLDLRGKGSAGGTLRGGTTTHFEFGGVQGSREGVEDVAFAVVEVGGGRVDGGAVGGGVGSSLVGGEPVGLCEGEAEAWWLCEGRGEGAEGSGE